MGTLGILAELGAEFAALDLSLRQARVLAAMMTSTSVVEACQKAGIDTSTYYRWRKDSAAFREGLDIVKRRFFSTIIADAERQWREELAVVSGKR